MIDFLSYSLDLKEFVLRNYIAVFKGVVQGAAVVGNISRCLSCNPLVIAGLRLADLHMYILPDSWRTFNEDKNCFYLYKMEIAYCPTESCREDLFPGN